VVVSCVVEGTVLFLTVVVEVVVVVGTGCSTTVVHEVKSRAASDSRGVRMISFFIFEVVSFH
jgi:hypothetical protein